MKNIQIRKTICTIMLIMKDGINLLAGCLIATILVCVCMENGWSTEERYLPKILVALGIYPSINEIRRNKPELMITLDKIDFVNELKVSKKRKVWIQVGE